MITTLIIFIITIMLMIASIILFPHIGIKKHNLDTYWIITIIGAILLFLFGKLEIGVYIKELVKSSSVNPIKIIVLFFSMTLISLFLDEFGFFRFVASKAVKISGNKQVSIFTIFYIVISILTVFTSNDIIILTFTPFILYFTKHSKIDPMPYLVSLFVAANTLSLTFVIGNPTNIYLALSKGINFVDYFKVMGYRTLILSFVAYLVLLLLFRKKLEKPMEKEIIEVKLISKASVVSSLVVLIICTILMTFSSYINLEMYMVSFISALLLTIFITIYNLIKHRGLFYTIDVFKKLPYSLIPFLFSMFAIVIALKENGITDKLVNLLNTNSNIFSIGYSSFLSCSLMNNIPMSVLYSSILESELYDIKCVYAAIVGSNFGALFTPIGALAGIMFLNIVNKNGIKMNYLDFTRYCMPISIILMSVALFLLLI